jgi:hypothetical protein
MTAEEIRRAFMARLPSRRLEGKPLAVGQSTGARGESGEIGHGGPRVT